MDALRHKAIFLLLLSYLLVQSVSSTSNGSPVKMDDVSPLCGFNNTDYFCPVDSTCKNRIHRCTLSSECVPNNGLEEKCFKSDVEKNAYTVYVGHAFPSAAAGSSLTEHQFIQYRGFTYEFVPSSGVHILDVNDPNYKYRDNRNISGNGIRNSGYSFCTWQDASLFVDRWKSADYSLFAKKCEKFAAAMQWYLTHGICSDSTIIVKRQDRYDHLEIEIDAILMDCGVVCCYNNNTASMPTVTHLTLLLVPITIAYLEFFKIV